MSIMVDETIQQYGYNPLSLMEMSGKPIIASCDFCSKTRSILMSSYSQSKNKGLCRGCARKKAHSNPLSGYKSDSYRKKRSEIATKSNKKRKNSSEKFQKYLPYLESLKDGKIGFTEIADKLGVDDSTVCRFFHSNFGLKSKNNTSLQEKEVFNLLSEIFPDQIIVRNKRYSSLNKTRSDFFIEGIGHIEYDGNGFFHQHKKSDLEIDEKFKPIRLNAQAVFGGIDYLNLIFLNKKTGYCAVSSPSEYDIKLLGNKKESTKMLENCHPLSSCAGTHVFGLFHKNHLIGVAKFGNPTNKNDKDLLELRRFFILDGTPRNTESWFLRRCELELKKDLVTYIHHNEKGSYLKALGWEKQPYKNKDYDYYLINGALINKRKMFGWAKRVGLVKKIGTTSAKEVLCHLMGGVKVIEPSKIKFIKRFNNGK